MGTLFADRVDAGRQLARALRDLAGIEPLIVLGLPRGGVPVAAQVARELGSRLDVFVVRKVGVPGREELAMGAVASGGLRVMNRDVVRQLQIPAAVIDRATEREQRELERRERVYRGGRRFPDLHRATVIVVDDGVATGATMLAAVRAIRTRHPARLVVAAPVMSREARQLLAAEADACISVAVPDPFFGVGGWYADFPQTTDAEVIRLLAEAGDRTGQEVRRAVGS